MAWLTRFNEIRKSLFYRLSEAYFFVTLATALIYCTLFIFLWRSFNDSTQQWLHWEVAESLAHDLRPISYPTLEKEKIRRALYRFASYNPRTQVSVLNGEGEIVLSVPSVSSTLDTAPLEEFLSFKGPPAKPILGPDPLSQDQRTSLFSVARLRLPEGMGFVYVVLRSHRSKKLFAAQGDTFAVYGAAGLVVLTLLLTLPLGILVFYFLTGRVRTMTDRLRQFESGDYSKRLPSEWRDEFGIHSRVFNQLADSLTAHIEKLTEMDASRREMFAGISHDLRTPVAAMRANLEALSQQLSTLSVEEAQRLIGAASAGSASLSNLLDDLFEISKLDQAEYRLEAEQFPLSELVEDVADGLTPLAEKQNVTLSFESDEQLPDAYGSPELLHRVLINLVENAIRYTLAGGSVRITLLAAGDMLSLEVVDTGIGMSSEELSKVTEHFYRTDRARELTSRGSGLGLSITKRIIELHGQTLIIESEEGKGSTFRFQLPTSQMALSATSV